MDKGIDNSPVSHAARGNGTGICCMHVSKDNLDIMIELLHVCVSDCRVIIIDHVVMLTMQLSMCVAHDLADDPLLPLNYVTTEVRGVLPLLLTTTCGP